MAAHMVDNVFPRLPVRQWVLSFPKRLRYFREREARLAGRVLQVFLRAADLEKFPLDDLPPDALRLLQLL